MRPVLLVLCSVLLAMGCSKSGRKPKYNFPSEPDPVKGCSIQWLRPLGLKLIKDYQMIGDPQVLFALEIRSYADVRKLLGEDNERLRGRLSNRKFCTVYLGKEILPGQVQPEQIVFVDPSTHQVIEHVGGF